MRWDMDISNTPSTTDDQELAKVLESMNEQADNAPATDQPADATVAPAADTNPVHDDAVVPGDPALSLDEVNMPPYLNEVHEQPETSEFSPVAPPAPAPTPEPPVVPEATPVVTPVVASPSPELESIKRSALEELRPLVDKLDLPADERFDTLLLLIRSTDDRTLVSAAHEAAQQITDDTKRAQALLDVIKEIDYFSNPTPQV